jgi:hypothetical protein
MDPVLAPHKAADVRHMLRQGWPDGAPRRVLPDQVPALPRQGLRDALSLVGASAAVIRRPAMSALRPPVRPLCADCLAARNRRQAGEDSSGDA